LSLSNTKDLEAGLKQAQLPQSLRATHDNLQSIDGGDEDAERRQPYQQPFFVPPTKSDS